MACLTSVTPLCHSLSVQIVFWVLVYLTSWHGLNSSRRTREKTLLLMENQQRYVSSLCGARVCLISPCWLGLSNENDTVREPFTAVLLLCFFGWWQQIFLDKGSTHSELQQPWDYSGFIELSKEPQTRWVRVTPGLQYPESFPCDSSTYSVNSFQTFLECEKNGHYILKPRQCGEASSGSFMLYAGHRRSPSRVSLHSFPGSLMDMDQID